MKNNHILNYGISFSISFNPVLEQEHFQAKKTYDKKRIFTISALAVLIAVCISFIAKLLVYLIDLFTNISIYGNLSIEPSSPANNTYGLFVIVIPAIGGLIAGSMAFYGSKAIRGHGNPFILFIPLPSFRN